MRAPRATRSCRPARLKCFSPDLRPGPAVDRGCTRANAINRARERVRHPRGRQPRQVAGADRKKWGRSRRRSNSTRFATGSQRTRAERSPGWMSTRRGRLSRHHAERVFLRFASRRPARTLAARPAIRVAHAPRRLPRLPERSSRPVPRDSKRATRWPASDIAPESRKAAPI